MGKKVSIAAMCIYCNPRNLRDCKEAFYMMEVDMYVNEKQDKMKHIV